MKRHLLQRETEAAAGDHMLETDIMRFVAIIGIVFWIIFALVHSLGPSPAKELAKKVEATRQPVAVATEEGRDTPESGTPGTEVAEVVEDASKEEPVATEVENPEMATKGLMLQFARRADLENLIAEGRIRLFGWAGGAGFDLFYAGKWRRGKMIYERVVELPSQLWEITTGKETEWFIREMDKDNPSLDNLPRRRVLISFKDRLFEERIEKMLARLASEGKSGTISIRSDAGMVFQESGHSVKERK